MLEKTNGKQKRINLPIFLLLEHPLLSGMGWLFADASGSVYVKRIRKEFPLDFTSCYSDKQEIISTRPLILFNIVGITFQL